MSGIADHVPYSEDRLKDLAQTLHINPALLWINPVTGALDVRESRLIMRPSEEEEE